MRVIVNTSPLIVLDRIGRIDLLRSLFGQVVRPAAVLRELQEGHRTDARRPTLVNLPWILTEDDPPEMAFRRELGSGETAAITLAYLTKADVVVLDDLQARLVARQLGLRLTGTLGILLASRAAGLIDDLPKEITQLENSGFRVAPQLKRHILSMQQ